MLTKDR